MLRLPSVCAVVHDELESASCTISDSLSNYVRNYVGNYVESASCNISNYHFINNINDIYLFIISFPAR